ncbi:uncharacterized protein LOC133192538 [Saccostrea echinata]|uniref:uncharacterized protein LOC133192538 n=1 Tax=Saccostrea echinata TaxID=191078 RepID=UPI002A7F2D13|nr:uncharacterized protein LOC133192538 [Saccostrea echinata]
MQNKMKWLFFLHVFVDVTAISDSSCEFPADLRGAWISSDKGFLRFSESVIYDYHVILPGVTSVDFICTENNGTHYLLKSERDINVFSMEMSVYICLSFEQVRFDNYIYYVSTPIESTVNESVYANSNLLNVSMNDVCSLPQTTDNMHSLIKNVSTDDIVSIECPNFLRKSFTNLNTEENGMENVCVNGSINGCLKNTQLVITSPSCHSSTQIPDNLSVYCLFHETVNDVTYLYTWTADTLSISKRGHGFICIEITHNESSATFRLFNDTCTDASKNTEFLKLKSKEIHEICQSTTPAPPPNRGTGHANTPKTKKKSTNWAIYFAIVVCIIIIIGFIVIIIKFFRKQMCDFFTKKPPQQSEKATFSNIAANSTDTLNTHI